MMDDGQEKSIIVTNVEEAGIGYDAASLRMSCESCGKSFHSPKALGGHMRIHASIRSKTNRSSVELGANADDLETKPNCSVCRRYFPSMKSLFGHMRCHPEREYRGIKAPADNIITKKNQMTTVTASSSSSTSSFDEIGNSCVDLMKGSAPWRWSTGKRGRKLISSATTSEEEEVNHGEDEKRLLDAVEVLLSLAHIDPFLTSEVTNSNSLSNYNNNKQATSDHEHEHDHDHEEKLDVSCPDIGSKSFMMGADDQLEGVLPTIDQQQIRIVTHLTQLEIKKVKKQKKNLMEDDDQLEGVVLPTVDQEQTTIITQLEMKKMKKKQKRKLTGMDDNINLSPNKKRKLHVTELNGAVEDQKYFKCSDCDKSFSTHQALGGHKSSHNKHMIRIQNQINSSSDINTMMTVTGDNNKAHERSDLTVKMQAETSSPSSSSTPHQCKRCSKIFPTGQALGGHMRRHYIGNLSDHDNSSSQANSPGETSQIGRIVHAFDLNQLPPIDQDELAANGCACASSSSYIINNN